MHFRILLLACCALLSVTSAVAAEPEGGNSVSRTPPPVFAEKLEALLTPLDTVRQLPKSGALRTEGPVIDETNGCSPKFDSRLSAAESPLAPVPSSPG